MSNPSLVVRIAASLSEFKQNLAEGRNQIEATTKGMKSLESSFSGDKIIRAAHDTAAAVQSVGGASKLTEAEQKKVNRTVTEAIEKYKVLGKEAPDALKQLQTETTKSETSTFSWGKAIGVGAAAVTAVGAAVAVAAQKSMDYSGKLTDLSNKTRVSAEALQRLEMVTRPAGISLETTANSIAKMGERLAKGDKSAVEGIAKLGLNVNTLLAAKPEQAFFAIGNAVAGIENPAQQAQMAMAIFGKSGLELLPALNDNFAEMSRAAQESSNILSNEAVAAGDAAGDAIGELGHTLLVLSAEALTPLMPLIKMAAENLAVAFSGAARFAADAIKWLVGGALELELKLRQILLTVAESVNKVPGLGKIFGKVTGDLDGLRKSVEDGTRNLEDFRKLGAEPTGKSVESLTQLSKTYTVSNDLMTESVKRGAKAVKDKGVVMGELSTLARLQIDGVVSPIFLDLETNTGNAERAMQELKDAIARVGGEAVTIGPLLTNTFKLPFEQLKTSVADSGTETDGFFTKVFGGATELGGSLTSIFQSAFTGGGGALGAAKSFATGAVSNLMGMIPVVGPFLSQFAGPLVAGFSKMAGKIKDIFSDLFGGPSRDELNGRNLVREFEDNLIGMLNAQQQAESGGERWAQVTIAVRDSYLALGLSAEQAETDVGRLFASSRDGAEASAAVIAQIQAAMQTAGQTAVGAVQSINRAIGDLPRSVNIPVNIETRRSGDGVEGYASGSGGIRDFGAGTLAVLHGRERVQTESQMRAEHRGGNGGDVGAALDRMMDRLEHVLPLRLRDAVQGAV